MSPDQTAIPEFLRTLNSQQQAAVLHGDKPLLIVAGAGTGKTTTLAHRVAWQILNGIDPSRILLLTFTRRAAAEMLRRAEHLLINSDPGTAANPAHCSRSAVRRISGGTFHSVATGLLRRYGTLIGLHPDFTILDRSDSEDLINVTRSKLNLAKTENRFPLKATCLDIYSRCVNTQQPLEAVLKKYFPWCLEHVERLAELFTAYTTAKEQQRVLDFDDLLLFWNALAENPDGRQMLRQQFQQVVVDEYQDTNILQAQILKNVVPDGRGLTAVGDDAQSIYSFRAATVRNILDFPEDFPGTVVIPLEQNYRSTQKILDVTNRVIAESAERHAKELWSARGEGEPPVLVTCSDEDAQSTWVIDEILNRREKGIALKRQAVLFRASHHSMALEAELGRRNVPFVKYGGLKFLETAHVRDLLSFLRLAENPLDSVAGFRVLVLLPGIGQAKAASLLESLRDSSGHFETWLKWSPPAVLRDSWPRLIRLLQEMEQRTTEADSSVATDIHATRLFYSPLLESKYDNVQARLNDLIQLEAIAARYQTRTEFLAEMTLDPPTSTQELPADPSLDEDYLILSTIHSAKGLEWDSVYVIHAADGNIPSDMATGSPEEIEEERRLFYVAMTRAKNHLNVIRPERYYFHHRRKSDQHSLSKMTRFLPASVQSLFDRRSVGPTWSSTGYGSNSAGQQGDTSEIRQRISRLWG